MPDRLRGWSRDQERAQRLEFLGDEVADEVLVLRELEELGAVSTDLTVDANLEKVDVVVGVVVQWVASGLVVAAARAKPGRAVRAVEP